MSALTHPAVVFAAGFLVSLALYWFAGMLGPATKKAEHKFESYACGEDYPSGKIAPGYDFFHVAFLFTILHVGVLLVATAPSGRLAWPAVALIAVAAATVAVFLLKGGESDA